MKTFAVLIDGNKKTSEKGMKSFYDCQGWQFFGYIQRNMPEEISKRLRNLMENVRNIIW